MYESVNWSAHYKRLNHLNLSDTRYIRSIECDVKPACEMQVRANDRDAASWWYSVLFYRKPDKNNKIKYFVYVIATDEKGTPSYSSRLCKVKWLKWRSSDVTSSTIFYTHYPHPAPGIVYSSTTCTEYRPFFKITQHYYGGVVVWVGDGVLLVKLFLLLLTNFLIFCSKENNK